jgi:hypothetical protein
MQGPVAGTESNGKNTETTRSIRTTKSTRKQKNNQQTKTTIKARKLI